MIQSRTALTSTVPAFVFDVRRSDTTCLVPREPV